MPQQPPQDRKGFSAARVAQRAVKKHLAAVARLLPRAARKGAKNAEAVHQLRVEARRASAALGLYAEFLPEGKAKRLRRELKKIRRAAGDARDLDVLIANLSHGGGKKNRKLLRRAREERKKARRRLSGAHRRAQERGFGDGIENLLQAAKKQRKAQPRAPLFAHWARAHLRPPAAAFFAAVPHDLGDAAALHRLRIRAKKLRYAMEMLDSAFPPAFHAELLPAVKKLQARLGDMNDLAAEQARIEKWARRGGAEGAEAQAALAANRRRLEKRQRKFRAWFTPAFVAGLHRGFGEVLSGLTVVPLSPSSGAPPLMRAS